MKNRIIVHRNQVKVYKVQKMFFKSLTRILFTYLKVMHLKMLLTKKTFVFHVHQMD